ncbi:atrial natriuretic peptide receptor 1-like [Paramacrobiotus metropolitanus]|uniref:atrial natriuretic peptide receptor 1-like n=1 Tax=Paramacrobiotus metropolitanus TaxID=2943436 RepID=UPI002445C4B8|nr:atrial natriuretic peptide receptor 1-like [Paramacrobiotus metropolitanus]
MFHHGNKCRFLMIALCLCFFFGLTAVGCAPITTTIKTTTATTAKPANYSYLSLQACLLIERGADLLYNYDTSAGAIDLAVAFSNQMILNTVNARLSTLYYDIGSACIGRNHLVAIAMYLRYQRQIRCDAFIGLGCAYNTEAVYDVADFFHIPVFGTPAAGVGVNADLSDYDYLTRPSITHTGVASAFMKFFRMQNYTTPAIIHDQDNSFYQQMGLVMTKSFQAQGSTLRDNNMFLLLHSNTDGYKEISTLLQTGATRSRVFIILADSNTTRQIMLYAYDLGMTAGDFVFLAVELFRSEYWGLFSYKADPPDGRDDDAFVAYKTLMLLALQQTVSADYDTFQRQAMKASATRTTYRHVFNSSKEMDLIVSHFYDAVVYFATLVKTLRMSGIQNFSEHFPDLFSTSFTFVSPVNGPASFADTGDRIFSYTLKSFNTESGTFDIAFGIPVESSTAILLSVLDWPGWGTRLPPNTPRCGFDGKAAVCAPVPMSTGALAAAILIPLMLITAGSVIGVILAGKFLNKNSDPFWWRIYSHELSQITSALYGSRAQSTALSATKSRLKSTKSLADAEKEGGDTASIAKKEISFMAPMDNLSSAYTLFTKTGFYKDIPVALRPFPEPQMRVNQSLGSELSPLKNLQHNNVQIFYGIAVNDENLCEYVVGDVCQKGSVMALIDKRKLNLDWEFKSALLKDTVAGMTYLHGSAVVSHGDLSAHTCLVDSRFVVKITDHGLAYFRDNALTSMPPDESSEIDFTQLLWRAPELLRRPSKEGTQKGDVYSFAIIIQQLILRSAPYQSAADAVNFRRDEYDIKAKELVLEVKRGASPPQRPLVPISAAPGALHSLMEQCWDERPELRPVFPKVREVITKTMGRAGENIVDHLIRRMEQYAAELEQEMQEKMNQFMEEKARSEAMLNGILPKTVSEALRKGQMVYPEVFTSTTVQFSDINGFPEVLAAAPTPFVTIEIMNTLYAVCDKVIENFSVYKVETVGDAYLLVSGLPIRNGIKHAGEMSTLALQMRKEVGALNFPSSPDKKMKLRVGINSGPCVASVIGLKMPRYCLFGDTVNTASRMESHGEAGKIQCSPTTKELLDKLGDYVVVSRGEMEVKGKGLMETFWLVAKTSLS